MVKKIEPSFMIIVYLIFAICMLWLGCVSIILGWAWGDKLCSQDCLCTALQVIGSLILAHMLFSILRVIGRLQHPLAFLGTPVVQQPLTVLSKATGIAMIGVVCWMTAIMTKTDTHRCFPKLYKFGLAMTIITWTVPGILNTILYCTPTIQKEAS